MKKKLLILVLAMVCAIACTLGLVACDKGNGDGDASNLEANEFASAFDTSVASGYTFTYKFAAKMEFKADVANHRYLTACIDEDITSASKMLYAKVGDKYYFYMSETNGEWWLPGVEMTEATFNDHVSNNDIIDRDITISSGNLYLKGINEYTKKIVSEKGKSFRADRENKYVAENVIVDGIGKSNKIEIVMQNNKLVSLSVKNYLPSEWSGNDGTDYSYTKFGETTVALPSDDFIVEPEMDADEWNACINAFVATKNFSLQMKNNRDEIVGAMKLDGDMYFETGGSSSARYDKIYDKDGNNYYRYDVADSNYYDAYDLENRVFYKTEIDENSYDSAVNQNACDLVSGAANTIRLSYSEFSYRHNVYTASEITVSQGLTLKNIKITVKNGEIKKVECTWAGTADKYITIDEIGSTSIEYNVIPETVFGQTFVLKKTWFTKDSNRYEVPYEIQSTCNASKDKTITIDANGVVGGEVDFGYGAFNEFTGNSAFTMSQASYGNGEYYNITTSNDDFEIGYITYKWNKTNSYDEPGVLTINIKYARGEAVFTFAWQPPQE